MYHSQSGKIAVSSRSKAVVFAQLCSDRREAPIAELDAAMVDNGIEAVFDSGSSWDVGKARTPAHSSVKVLARGGSSRRATPKLFGDAHPIQARENSSTLAHDAA
jgi:hypothetical protein